MMNYIWAGILLVSVVYAMFSGNLDALGTALTESSNEAVEFVIGLAGICAEHTVYREQRRKRPGMV